MTAFPITGRTGVIAHIGYPTHSFKAPLIYNPYFAEAGIDQVVVPLACQAAHFEPVLRAVFALENVSGALITMPHKVSVVSLLDVASTAVRISGACNAVRRLPDGRLAGDMFDGEGFVRGLRHKGVALDGARVFIAGAGGVGSAIAAAFAAARAARITLFDVRADVARSLADRLREHHPGTAVTCTTAPDPSGHGIAVNATPLGMEPGDPLPMDVDRLAPGTVVGEVVMRERMTAFLRAAAARGCLCQVGTDMLFEQIPAYLEFFGLPSTTPEHLRRLAPALA